MMIRDLIRLSFACLLLSIGKGFKGKLVQRLEHRYFAISEQSEPPTLPTLPRFPELQRCLAKEYASFFNPMEKKFYTPDVEFIDPLNSFKGLEKYQGNVDMLAGRTSLGKFLFQDASIVLHNIQILSENQLQTRWTLQVTVKSVPWQPRAKFTGVSVYTLNAKQQIAKQEDYWDSINLINGKYVKKGLVEGAQDFAEQLKRPDGAALSAPELPYELLRRAKYYEVRRYPPHLSAETTYDKRPEGYDRLGSYCGGSNEGAARVPYFSPTLMRIEDREGRRGKVMSWPLLYPLPGQALPSSDQLPVSTIPSVKINPQPGRTVAVIRFEAAATEETVRKVRGQLLELLRRDGLGVEEGGMGSGEQWVVGQFDALFSLNKRRNEVWVELGDHPWK